MCGIVAIATSASICSQAPSACRQGRLGPGRGGGHPLSARTNLSSVPAPKSYAKCADQPVAANN